MARRFLTVALAAAATAFAVPAMASAATFTVNSTNDPGIGGCDAIECTLREAINAANSAVGADTIAFNIPGGPPHSIKPLTQLPPVTDVATRIDGTTEPNFAGSPVVELDGSLAGPTGSGIILHSTNNVVAGLVINRFAPAANQQGGGIFVRFGGRNLIVANYIGTDVTGTLPLGNSSGIWISGPIGSNQVGATTPAARNIIADNKGPNGAGIWTANPSNVIEGNYIGTDVTGTNALGNGFGLVITGPNNRVGGTSPAARNVISGNRDAALQICANCAGGPTVGNVVQGNYIGTNASGTSALPNIDNFGAAVLVRAAGNTIGGTAPGAGNVISGNIGTGLVIGFLFGNVPPANNNTVAGNLIGTAADGVTSLGNTAHGVHVGQFSPASQNTIGGTTASATNTIANNGQAGVFVESNSNQNAILRNSIHSNGLLGIDLFPPGPTPNDPGDGDAGANQLQNAPVLSTSSGTLSSAPNTTYRIEFFSNTTCDPSGFGEGQTFNSTTNVTTNGAGVATFSVPGAANLTATATDPANNTSEFSNCVTTQAGPGPPATLTLSPATDTNPAGTEHCVTATVRDASGNPTPNITVRFSVTGANTASGTDTTDANGEATFCYTGTNAGEDTIRAFADTDNDASQDPGEPFGVATKTYTPAAPATLTLDPPADTNELGTQHCVTATVRDAFGNPVPGVTVRFTVTGSVNTSGSATTDANGEAQFCYQGPELPGEDAITAFADTDNDGTQDPGEPSGAATKTWVLPVTTPLCEAKITEGGYIHANNGDRASFGGNAQSDGQGNVKGEENYQDHGPAQPQHVKSIELLALTCNQQRTRATIFGLATIDGQGSHLFRIDLQDLGEPGMGVDTYRILLDTGYDSGEHTLEGGNVQIHKS